MSNIIKRRKTVNYTQINNHPVQKDLGNLSAIGLLTYVMSLPEDWVLHKTHLQKTFTRRTVDSAWKVLVEKKYAIGFYSHVNGKKNYFYMVSDIPFTGNDFDDLVKETIKELQENGDTVYNVLPIMDSPYKIPAEISIVHNVHHITNSSNGTTTKELITKETITNKHSLSIDNYQELGKIDAIASEEPIEQKTNETEASPEQVYTNACNEFYTSFAVGRWSKKQWNILVKKFVTETFEAGRHNNIPPHKIKGYCYKALEAMAINSNDKKDRLDRFEMYAESESEIESALQHMPANSSSEARTVKPVPFYDWLNERD